jgi:hypothetical protein
MSPDSFDQLSQARNFFFTNWHPLFSTLYVYFFDKLFGSPIGISIANTGIFLLFLLLSINTFKNNKKALTVSLLFYCFMPIYYLFNMALWKDVPYSYFLAISMVFLYRVLVNNKLKDLLLFITCILLVTLFRHNGITVAIAASTSILLLDGISKKIKLLTMSFLMISIIVMRLLLTSFLPGAQTPIIINQSNFYIVLMSHISSLPYYGGENLINELEPLSPVIDPQKLASSYRFGYLPILLFDLNVGLDHSKVLSHKKLIVKTFIELFLKYPLLISRSILVHGALVWSPIKLEESGYYIVEPGGDVCEKQSRAYSEYKCNEYKVQKIRYVNFISQDITEKLTALVFHQKYKNIFFMRPSIYLFAMVISATYLLARKRELGKKVIILTLPLTVQTFTMFFLSQSQDFRYHLSLAVIAPIFLIMIYKFSKGDGK